MIDLVEDMVKIKLEELFFEVLVQTFAFSVSFLFMLLISVCLVFLL